MITQVTHITINTNNILRSMYVTNVYHHFLSEGCSRPAGRGTGEDRTIQEAEQESVAISTHHSRCKYSMVSYKLMNFVSHLNGLAHSFNISQKVNIKLFFSTVLQPFETFETLEVYCAPNGQYIYLKELFLSPILRHFSFKA